MTEARKKAFIKKLEKAKLKLETILESEAKYVNLIVGGDYKVGHGFKVSEIDYISKDIIPHIIKAIDDRIDWLDNQ